MYKTNQKLKIDFIGEGREGVTKIRVDFQKYYKFFLAHVYNISPRYMFVANLTLVHWLGRKKLITKQSYMYEHFVKTSFFVLRGPQKGNVHQNLKYNSGTITITVSVL